MVTIKPKLTVKIREQADCPSHSRSDISVRDVGLTIDEPSERGGTNLGPAPTETAIAALIGCINTISHKCAAKLGVDIGALKILAVCDFDRRGVTLQQEVPVPFERVDVEVEYAGRATQDEADRVAAETEKFCPVSRMFRAAGTDLSVVWKRGAA